MTDTEQSPDSLQVEIWSDVACPWCYIGTSRFAKVLETFDRRDDVELIPRAYQLSPETPAGSGERELDALVRSKGMSPEQVRGMFEHVGAIAKADGLDIDFDTTITANTFDAHRLVQIAGRQDKAMPVLNHLFRAHFAEGLAIDDLDVLVDIADAHGVDHARVALTSVDAADEVRADLAAARELQVTGVPFFVAGRRVAVSGAQPAEVLTQLLEQGFERA